MAQVHLQIGSFNAGELSPLLGARFGVEKVASGCRRLRNFLLHVHGPVFRRPGMEWLGASASDGAKSRLLAFNFSTTTGAILEFHPSGLRVWENGLLVPLRNPVALPYSEAECAEVQMVQVNDVCYLAHPNHAVRKLTRFSDTDWRIEEITWKWPALGDENVRSDEIAAPTSTELLSLPAEEWPEFTVPTGSFDFDVVNPDLSAATKTATLRRYDAAGNLLVVHTFTWTATAPATYAGTFGHSVVIRMTYAGPVTATCALVTTWGAGAASMAVDVVRPMSARTVSVAAGDWQVSVASPAAIPSGATLRVQRLDGAAWVTAKQLRLLPSQTTVYRGTKLTAAKTFRLLWTGKAMSAGIMKVEQVVFPSAASITLAVSDTTGNGRTMTASAPIFMPGHVGGYWQITHRRENASVVIQTGAPPAIAAATSARLQVAGKWQVLTYGIWATTLFLEKKFNGVWETLRSWSGHADRNVIADGDEDHAVELRLRVLAGGSVGASGADAPRFVLEALDPTVNGLVKVTAIGALTNGKASTATVDVISPLFATTATTVWTEGAWSGVKGYPRTLALHGGRMYFGGTRAEPTRIWGTVVNDYIDFRRSSFDDAGVSFTPASQTANAIQWMLSQEKELIFGTAGDEWTLGTESGPISPTNVLMQRRSGYGSQSIPALLLGEVVIFVQRGGRKLRQITPHTDAQAWSAADLTVLAEHVAQSGVVQAAAMNNPFSILWAVTGGGKLLGMTFEQEQNVFGWHIHETDGRVESVAVLRGAGLDEVWLSVLRDGKRSIERLDSSVMGRRFDTRERLIYLDAAVRRESADEILGITGLEHLEGRDVSVVGDGAEQSARRVIGGAIALETPARTVVVGIPYVSELQPMRVDVPLRDGTAQGRRFKVTRVVLNLHESLGGEVAEAETGRFEKLNYRRTATPMDEPPALFTGELETVIAGNAREGVDVFVRQRSPLPFNLGAIVVKADVYGE